MSQQISIQIDLDSEQYVSGVSEITKSTNNLDQAASRTFGKTVPNALGQSNKAVNTLTSSFNMMFLSVNNIVTAATVIGTALVFAESKFGLLTKAGKHLNFNIIGLVEASKRLAASFREFVYGEKSFKALGYEAGLFLQRIGLMDSKLMSIVNTTRDVNQGIGAFVEKNKELVVVGGSVLAIAKNFTALKATVTDVSNVSSKLINTALKPKGLYELVGTLAAVSGALFLVSENMLQSENATTRWAGTILKLGAIITGGLAAWLSIAIVKISDLAINGGKKLTEFFVKTSESFIKTSSDSKIFIAAIEAVNRATDGVAGSGEEWERVISQISTSLNITSSSLRKSAQEILLVGSHMGLTTKQMEDLLKISAEYAKINHKDVFETTVAVTNALNGSSQSVQALGIKLSEASVQQYAFSKGITDTMGKMSEGEKIQLRFNKLTSQYEEIAGLGAIAAGTLADQQNELAVNTERLYGSLGKGASIIEMNNIKALLMNKILGNVNESVISVAGFFGALGARLLTVGGILISITFKIYAITKALTLLDVLLQSKAWDDFSSKKIPLLDKSFNDLIYSVTGANVKLKSSKDLLYLLGSATIEQAKFLVGLGNSAAGSSTKLSVLSSVINGVLSSLKSLGAFLIPFLIPFAKIVAIAALVTGAFLLVKRSIEEIEKRTQAFSKIWGILVDTWNETPNILEPIINFFGKMRDVIMEIGSKAFGMFVFGLSKVVGALTHLMESNPFGVFSEKTITKITELNSKLSSFSESLQAVAFDIRQIPMDAERSIASVGEKSLINLEDLVTKLNALRDNFKDFGLTDVEVVRKREQEALETLKLSYENKMLAEQEYQTLRTQVIQDANIKVAELDKKSAKDRERILSESNKIISNGLANALSGGIQNIVKSIMSGESVFKNFSAFIIQTFGDLATQLGQFFIMTGIAFNSMMSLSGPQMIAAGAGLVALGAILSSFSGKGIGGGGGVSAVGAQPAPGQFSTDMANPESINEERKNPQTNVSIVVQGSLVRQDELGQFITETLNESFAKQGVTLTDARFA